MLSSSPSSLSAARATGLRQVLGLGFGLAVIVGSSFCFNDWTPSCILPGDIHVTGNESTDRSRLVAVWLALVYVVSSCSPTPLRVDLVFDNSWGARGSDADGA